jgi:glycosyltransferase involved in cell wall biosynthesis
MKVLFISSWYPNSTDPLKGIYVKKHAEAIRKAGIEIEVLALTVSHSDKLFQKKISKTIDEAGMTTHLIELNSKFYKFIHIDRFWQYGALWSYYKENIKPAFKADIIHSNVLYPAAILGYKLAKKENLPHIITEHWSKVDKFFSKSWYAGVGKKAYNSAKYVTAVSDFLRNSLAKHFDDPAKIKVVPNVVDSDLFSFRVKADHQKLVFCCVAHWNGVKRPDLIFNALEQFSKQSSKPILLKVIGEGHYLDPLKKQKWNFEISYLGNRQRKELAEQLQSSDYFLHASTMETFSIVIAEALATGTPVVASDAGAIPELINKENGLICNNDVDSWVKGLNEITSKNFDHQKISEAANNYGLERIGKQFLELYNS